MPKHKPEVVAAQARRDAAPKEAPEKGTPPPIVRPLNALKRNGRGTTRATHLRLERGERIVAPSTHPPYGRRATDRAASIWVDAALREEVMQALRERPDLGGCEIDVFAAAGEVVLIGTVPTFQAEQRAVEVAARCHGVRSVMSQMHLVLHAVEDTAEGVAPPLPINAADATALTDDPTM